VGGYEFLLKDNGLTAAAIADLAEANLV